MTHFPFFFPFYFCQSRTHTASHPVLRVFDGEVFGRAAGCSAQTLFWLYPDALFPPALLLSPPWCRTPAPLPSLFPHLPFLHSQGSSWQSGPAQRTRPTGGRAWRQLPHLSLATAPRDRPATGSGGGAGAGGRAGCCSSSRALSPGARPPGPRPSPPPVAAASASKGTKDSSLGRRSPSGARQVDAGTVCLL